MDPKTGITRCIRHALTCLQVAVPQPDRLTWCIGPPLKSSFSNLLNTRNEAILDRAIQYYRERFARIGMFENEVFPGTVSSLRKLRSSGFDLYLATSKPHVFASKILAHFNLTPFFTQIYGSELDGRFSDKGALIAHIIDREALNPLETMMVGDRIHDIDGGRQNRLTTAAVSYGYGTPEEIAAAEPDYVFDSLQALTQAVLRNKP